MKCNNCGSEMRLDDVDFNFRGNYDNYYECDNCGCCCTEKVRYGKSVNLIWDKSVCEVNNGHQD